VAKAYAELESQGVIESLPGKGSFIRAQRSPLRKEARLEILAREIDGAVVQAHHLQVEKPEFLRLTEERFDAFERGRP
jgi:GntR family transcriptional regulator